MYRQKNLQRKEMWLLWEKIGDIYDLKKYLACQARHEGYMLEENIFDSELNKIKVEDDDYDKETDVEDETKKLEYLSQALVGLSRVFILAWNQEELDSIDWSTRYLLKLEKFYNQDPLRYLNENDSYFEDVDMGHVVIKTVFFGGGEWIFGAKNVLASLGLLWPREAKYLYKWYSKVYSWHD